MVDKYFVIINGIGESGKDTLVKIIGKYYKIRNESSIDPIKNIAKIGGWNGKKDERSRKLLSDLKKLFIEYNDLPTEYIVKQYDDFMKHEDQEIMFAHVREGAEIEKLKNRIDKCPCITLLITNNRSPKSLGNSSDDRVEDYKYDYVYHNDYPLYETEKIFVKFFNKIKECKK